MDMRQSIRVWGGELRYYQHLSSKTGTQMSFGVFLPPGEVRMSLLWLSGLTCTEENFMIKAGAFRKASEQGIALITPDTSPRGTQLPGEHDSWDFGSGAGFYVDATQEPWSSHYQMHSYITEELCPLLNRELGLGKRFALSGHSMGGHGALVLGIRHPELFNSVSALAPIVAPTQVPWGIQAFRRYLGEDESAWRTYDACALIKDRGFSGRLLVDQGKADEAIDSQLRPQLLASACSEAGVELELRYHEGYDHGYFFVQSFIEDHLDFHLGLLA